MVAAQERRKELTHELDDRARRRRRRGIVIAANLVAVAVATTVGWRLVARARAIRAALDHDEAPFVTNGWVEVTSNQLTASRALEADLPGSSCFVAVATTDAKLRARAGATAMEAARSAGWCACSPAHVTVEAPATEGEHVGLAVMRIDARVIGGPLARPWVELSPAGWGAGGDECAEATVEGWIADGRWPRPAVDDTWFAAAPARASLRRAGFHVVSGVQARRPFGVVDTAAGDCVLAIGTGDDGLSVLAAGGARLIARASGALAWCDASGARTTVWREGSSPVVVLAAPAARVGGLLGTRECAEVAGIHVAPDATWMRDTDLAWDAASLLRASTLSGVVTGPLPTEPGSADGRVVALALSPAAQVAVEPAGVAVACDPPLDGSPRPLESVCAQAAPVAWWRRTDAPAAAARAPLPFWLSSLEPHREADALALVPEFLALARRLARDGFEPSVLEGVTELKDGVRVVGRAGEDAIVAIGIGPSPPWTFPYTDGVAWDLEDAPRVIELQPGTAVKLTSTPSPNAPLDKRRTVVFRRALRP
jgi:hypothetical protein